jgi:hypothetical protein
VPTCKPYSKDQRLGIRKECFQIFYVRQLLKIFVCIRKSFKFLVWFHLNFPGNVKDIIAQATGNQDEFMFKFDQVFKAKIHQGLNT